MAFLCPSRRGRQKKKHKAEPKSPFMGRITGSASVDTLVRVGLEKQHGLAPDARMRVTQDFLATRKDELGAQKGDTLYKLYQDGDWVYVITDAGREGFIPTICVTPAPIAGTGTGTGKGDEAPFRGLKPERNSYCAASENEAGLRHRADFPAVTPNGVASGAKSALAVPKNHHLSSNRRRNSAGLDLSTQAETGSDVSSSSLSQGGSLISPDTINPIPKPSRSHKSRHTSTFSTKNDIPDVISTTGNPQNSPTASNASNSKNSVNRKTLNSPENFLPSVPNGIGHRGNNSNNHNYDNNNNNIKGDKGFRNSQKNLKTSNSSIEVFEDPGIDTPNFLSPDRATIRDFRSSRTSTGDSITEVKTFVKTIGQKLVVVFSFVATDENDVTVERGEVVTSLNDKDPQWVWVKKRNGKEGFVPSAFMCSMPENLLPNTGSSSGKSDTRPKEVASQPAVQTHDVRELYTLRRFTAQSADDICVEAGEQVFADLANQIEEDWLWVYAPTNQHYGYIPKDNVALPPNSPAPPNGPNTDTSHKRYSYH